jgi:hypothetical protein
MEPPLASKLVAAARILSLYPAGTAPKTARAILVLPFGLLLALRALLQARATVLRTIETGSCSLRHARLSG